MRREGISHTSLVLLKSIRKVQETKLGLDMNGIHRVLGCADDLNLIGDIRTIERNAKMLINACRDIG